MGGDPRFGAMSKNKLTKFLYFLMLDQVLPLTVERFVWYSEDGGFKEPLQSPARTILAEYAKSLTDAFGPWASPVVEARVLRFMVHLAETELPVHLREVQIKSSDGAELFLENGTLHRLAVLFTDTLCEQG